MWQQIERSFQLVFGLLLGIAAIFVGWSMLKETTLNLNSARKYHGVISSRHIGRTFSFNVADTPIPFEVYKASRNYDDLKTQLDVGDSVTVFLGNSSTANSQVYQVEKNGRVVVGKELLEGQNRIGSILCFVGGFALMSISIGQFLKK